MATLVRINWIKKNRAAAVLECQGTGLFPDLLLIQAILEGSRVVNGVSVPGASVLAAMFNNHFGVKAAGLPIWTGAIARMPTREVFNGKSVMIYDNFRAYPTVQAGFKGRNAFLIANPRYRKAGVFVAKTPQDQALAFQRAGYATDPNYAKLLISMLTTYRQWLP